MEKFLNFYARTDKVTFYSVAFPFLCAITIALSVLLTHSHLPKILPLFYSLPFGTQEFVTPSQFSIFPLLIILIALINLTLSWHLHRSQIVLKRILNITGATVALFMLITALRILLIFL